MTRVARPSFRETTAYACFYVASHPLLPSLAIAVAVVVAVTVVVVVVVVFAVVLASYENAPIQKELAATEVGACAAFLCSPLASAVTGACLYVDNGLNTMGLAVDSKTLERKPEA